MQNEVFGTLSDVEALKVEWLMEPYIPYGMITVMEGDPGRGKSYLAMHLAAQISIGGGLPGDEESSSRKGALHECRGRSWDELRRLRREIREEQTDLVILDPLFAYIPANSDMYRPNHIRALLSTLNDIAKKYSTAILIIRHLTKAKHDKAIYQGAGSMDVIGAARSALLVAVHPDDPEIRVVAHIKHNLSPRGPSLEYRLYQEANDRVPIVEWLGESSLHAEDLLNLSSAEEKSALEQAIEFLKDQLEEGPKKVTRIYADGEKRSISQRTLNRAKEHLKIRSHKTSEGSWIWRLPSKEAQNAKRPSSD